jgi:hypothetical protein
MIVSILLMMSRWWCGVCILYLYGPMNHLNIWNLSIVIQICHNFLIIIDILFVQLRFKDINYVILLSARCCGILTAR